MFDDNYAHKILLIGIGASLSFTIFVTAILFQSVEVIHEDIKILISDVSFIKGSIEQWPTYETP